MHSHSYPDIEAVPMDRVIERAIRAFCRKSPGFPDLSLTAMAKDIADAVSRAMPSVAQAPASPAFTPHGNWEQYKRSGYRTVMARVQIIRRNGVAGSSKS